MITRRLTRLPLLTVDTPQDTAIDAEVQGWNIKPTGEEGDDETFEYLDVRIEVVATIDTALDTCFFLSMTKEQALMFANDIIKEVTDGN